MTDIQEKNKCEDSTLSVGEHGARKPYEPPRVEKKRSLERVTLLSGMGQSAVGVLNMIS
jgi:hypothetical protein